MHSGYITTVYFIILYTYQKYILHYTLNTSRKIKTGKKEDNDFFDSHYFSHDDYRMQHTLKPNMYNTRHIIFFFSLYCEKREHAGKKGRYYNVAGYARRSLFIYTGALTYIHVVKLCKICDIFLLASRTKNVVCTF